MRFLARSIFEKSMEPFSKEAENYEELWRNRLNQYWNSFKNIKNGLDERFVEYYTKCALHDDQIIKIEIDNISSIANIAMFLKSYQHDNIYKIVYNNVHKLRYSFIDSMGSYLFGEILKKENNLLSHEFCTSNDCSFFVLFEFMSVDGLNLTS